MRPISVAVVIAVMLFSCGQDAGKNTSYNSTGFDVAKDESAALDTAHEAHSGKIPVTADDVLADYTATHEVPPLARSIAEGNKLDLTRDMEVLALVDSMVNASDGYSRTYYYLIVSRTLKWSDGYYSEGVGNVGTSYLFKYPSEFLTNWWHLLASDERLLWADRLAGEQGIITEGYPCDTVMFVFRSRLKTVVHEDDRLNDIADRLAHQVDSLLCQLKSREQ